MTIMGVARRRLLIFGGGAAIVLAAALVTAVAVSASQGSDAGPGQHFTNPDGSPVGFAAPSGGAAPAAKHPEIVGGRQASMSCARAIGPTGAFEPEPGLFHGADGVIAGGYRAVGSDGNTYELFGGARVPANQAMSSSNDAARAPGFIQVDRYAGSTVDPCKALGDGSDRPKTTRLDVPPAASGPVTFGSVSGNVITYQTRSGATGRFDFVTQTFS